MKDETYNETEQTISEETQVEGIKMKIPETTDKPKHHEATASIYTYGLSVMCANETDKSAEIAFVKDEHSAVEIIVYKAGCEFLWSHTCDINKKTKIEIQKSNPSTIGRLYKNSKKDKEDFEWMPDLNGSDWYPNTKIGIKSGAKNHLSAKLILKDAHFYTHLKSVHNAIQDRKVGGKKNIGKIGRVIGADIFCDTDDEKAGITITINSGGEPKIIFLPKSDGPFFISVATDSESDTNHLPHLYHHIIDLPGVNVQYDFEYEQREDEWALCPKPQADDGKVGILVTTFACQTFPGGDGPLPDFP